MLPLSAFVCAAPLSGIPLPAGEASPSDPSGTASASRIFSGRTPTSISSWPSTRERATRSVAPWSVRTTAQLPLRSMTVPGMRLLAPRKPATKRV
jgi:hypothetical protein